MNDNYILSLLHQYADGSISSSDLSVLADWLKNNPDEKLSQLIKQWFLSANPSAELDSDTREKIHQNVLAEITRKKNSVKMRFKLLRAAAAVLIAFLIGAVALYSVKRDARTTIQQNNAISDAMPGVKGGVLETFGGKKIVLEPDDNGIRIDKLFSKIKNIGANRGAKLITRNGQEINITLPDGTRVWLNAGSELSFPQTFKGGERVVSLNGEAYFEVHHDAAKPFRINLPGTAGESNQIKVLGTRFNVSAYSGDRAIKATLVEGRINITNGINSYVLKPGQEASITNKNERQLMLADADTELAVSWKEGYFKFDDTPICDILTKIGRWYNIDIVYEGNIPASNYTGTISKSLKLSNLVEALNVSGLQFRFSGKKLIVSHANT